MKPKKQGVEIAIERAVNLARIEAVNAFKEEIRVVFHGLNYSESGQIKAQNNWEELREALNKIAKKVDYAPG